jgi:large subunit ribosomal protein L13
MRQTTFRRKTDTERQWRHIDAEGQILGRLASTVAVILMGKHRPDYTPHVDTGDFVVITNAEKIKLTGRKAQQRLKTRFTGYPGGLKAESFGEIRERRPEFLIEDAVRRMLPKSRLGRQMIKKLKVYAGPEHPHSAQQPATLEV